MKRFVLLKAYIALIATAPASSQQAQQPGYDRKEVIYGRKCGTALTLDVFTPKNSANSADVIVGATVNGHVKVFDGQTSQDGVELNRHNTGALRNVSGTTVVDLAVPETEAAARAGSVYTVAFGGSLLG